MQDIKQRRIQWAARRKLLLPAAAGDISQREHLQRPDDAEHRVEEDDRRYARHGDIAELAHTPSAINISRFIQFFGNALQRRQEDQHGIAAQRAPQADDDQRRLG